MASFKVTFACLTSPISADQGSISRRSVNHRLIVVAISRCLDASTATHRSYASANRPSPISSYGGGPGAEHNYTSGLLLYHYLTGDRRAREAVIQLSDWVIAMDDGAQTVLPA